MPEDTKRFVPHPDTLLTDLQDELVLIQGANGKAYRFNGSARWLYLRLPATRSELIADLCSQYAVEPAQAALDTDEAIDAMLKADLVSRDE